MAGPRSLRKGGTAGAQRRVLLGWQAGMVKFGQTAHLKFLSPDGSDFQDHAIVSRPTRIFFFLERMDLAFDAKAGALAQVGLHIITLDQAIQLATGAYG